jgi:ribonuclease VapC
VTRIVVDTSALMAMVLREPDFERFENVLAATEGLLSAASRVELGCAAMARRGPAGARSVAELVDHLGLEVIPVDQEQTKLALDALARFGRARGKPPAVLNYGDLFSYALAKSRDLPLLYKGDDFAKTDIRPAIPASGGAP